MTSKNNHIQNLEQQLQQNPSQPITTNGWDEWGRHVLAELIRLNDNIDKIEVDIRKIDTKIATLEVKSGVWGLIGGLIPILIFLFFQTM